MEEDQPGSREVLRIAGVAKEFRTGWIRRRTKTVLEDVSFSVFECERLGIMGPSGQGKTTLARIVLGLQEPSRGSLRMFVGNHAGDLSQWLATDRARFRRSVQMLYQDADLVLDPAQPVGDALVEAYRVFDPQIDRAAAYRWAAQILDELALPESLLQAYPYRLSGGERKRIALARGLAALGCPFPARPDDPWRLLVLDEPTAGIDVVLQAILSRFLIWVQHRLRLCYLVISHDESFIQQFCHRALRLENGRLRPA